MQNRCISFPIAIVTVPVYHIGSVANKHELVTCSYLLCIVYTHWHEYTHQNCMKQCICMPDFEVLHAINMQTQACTHTGVQSLKLSSTITANMI